MTHSMKGLRWAFQVLVLLLLAATPARAEQPEDCPLWFPDFRCERSGRFEGFVTPMASPFLFEEPFITTGVSVWGMWHDYPGDSVFQGGEAWAVAVQARVAITDRLAFIATKDGYALHRPDNPILHNAEGFLDISAGFKYALVEMPEKNFILTPSLRFDIPTGSSDLFSGNGDGVAIPAISLGWGTGNFHLIADLGGRIPFDGDAESTSLFYHLHADYAVTKKLVPFVELSGYHWTGSGDGSLGVDTALGRVNLSTAQALLGTGPFEGADLVNLGSAGIAGANLVTLSFGVRIPLSEHVMLGAAYEFPVTSREDIFRQRASLNVAFEL